MAHVTVERTSESTVRVIVEEAGSRTVHDVTVTADHVARYAPGARPARLVEASFAFLLEREPKEAILSRFELPVIERYFPEYPRTIRAMVSEDAEKP